MNITESIRQSALETIEIEQKTVAALKACVDDTYIAAVQAIYDCSGRVVVTGIGKSAVIGQKLVATLNSTGTPAIFMHAADAVHGDLGMIREDDIVLCISKSGNSPEIKVMLPFVKSYSNQVVALVSNASSYLAQNADHTILIPVEAEADPNNLAPTASTTAQMVIGDAIAVSLLRLRGFTPDHFAKFHPGGSLGKQLYTKVADIMKSDQLPHVGHDAKIRDIILSITTGMKGVTAVMQEAQVIGVITDGDLRRMLERYDDLSQFTAADIMNNAPKAIAPDRLATDALHLMRSHSISQLLVLDEVKALKGIIHIHDLVKEGII